MQLSNKEWEVGYEFAFFLKMCLLQAGRDGVKKLDEWGTLKEYRPLNSITSAEVSAFNDIKTLVEKNKGQLTETIQRKIRDAILVTLGVIQQAEDISQGIEKCSFLQYVSSWCQGIIPIFWKSISLVQIKKEFEIRLSRKYSLFKK